MVTQQSPLGIENVCQYLVLLNPALELAECMYLERLKSCWTNKVHTFLQINYDQVYSQK